MKTRIIAVIAILLPIAGCGYFAPDIRVTHDVAPQEVVGTWILRDDSLKLAVTDSFNPYPSQSGRHHEITFGADGRCHYKSIRQMPSAYLECDGMWAIERSSDERHVPVLSVTLTQGGGYMFTLNFTEENGRLVVWEYWGDPDSWQFLKYDKSPN